MNNVVLIGRLSRDPEYRKTQNDMSVASFNLAIKRDFNEDETDFINCVAYRSSADYLFKYGHKGDLVSTRGRIQTRSYDSSEGLKRYVTEVICDKVSVLSFKSKQEEPVVEEESELEDINEIVLTDDDLPF